MAAAGNLVCFKRLSVKEIAVSSNSRHLAVRFSGRGVVDRIKSVSDMSRFIVESSLRLVAMFPD